MSSKDEPSREDLWKQLQNAVAAWSSQDQVIWSMFSIFWAANALLLVAIFTSNGTYVVSIVSAVGIFTSIVWLMLLHRAIGHITIYENLMRDIENTLLKDHSQFRLTLAPNAKSNINWPKAKVVWRWSVRIFLMIWILGLSIGLCLLMHILL